MSVRSVILSQFESVAREQRQELAPLSDDLKLFNCGLDSLCLAIIVDRLKDILGRDPFNDSRTLDFPLTLDGFIKLYESNGK
jgi:hypothetical protein